VRESRGEGSPAGVFDLAAVVVGLAVGLAGVKEPVKKDEIASIAMGHLNELDSHFNS